MSQVDRRLSTVTARFTACRVARGKRTTAVLRLAIVIFAILAAACSDKSNPAAPASPSPPTVSSLAIIGDEGVLTNTSTAYIVTATLSDGTTRALMPTWSSSHPDVASIDSDGLLSGRVHGSATLTASHDGRSATKTVQVVNNYGGTWNGTYVVKACTDSGDLTNRDGGWCRSGPGRVGNVGSIALALTQTGSHLSDITGTLVGDDVGRNITGVVTPDGRLSLTGGPFGVWDWEGTLLLATWRMRAWDTTLGGPGTMTGRWSQDYTSVYFRIGSAKMDHELVAMTRIESPPVSNRSSVRRAR